VVVTSTVTTTYKRINSGISREQSAQESPLTSAQLYISNNRFFSFLDNLRSDKKWVNI